MPGFHIFTVSLVKHVPDNLFPASKNQFFIVVLKPLKILCLAMGLLPLGG
jgi:hypothetical protein